MLRCADARHVNAAPTLAAQPLAGRRFRDDGLLLVVAMALLPAGSWWGFVILTLLAAGFWCWAWWRQIGEAWRATLAAAVILGLLRLVQYSEPVVSAAPA